jgi:hypothetical protein
MGRIPRSQGNTEGKERPKIEKHSIKEGRRKERNGKEDEQFSYGELHPFCCFVFAFSWQERSNAEVKSKVYFILDDLGQVIARYV